MSAYLELAKKIKRLAEEGSPGEKENAIKALEKIMSKHGITKSDLDEELEDYRKINVGSNKFHFKLFEQICYVVFDEEDYDLYSDRKNPKIKYVFTTLSKFVEIECMFEFYRARYDEQLELYYEAFLMKNNLYPRSGYRPASEFSDDELEKMRKAAAIADGLEESQFKKQLKAG